MSHPIARRAGMLALTAAMLMPSAGALSDVSSWAQEGVAAAQNAGLAPSSLSNSAASGSITRAEFCAVALNAYKAVSGKAVYVSGTQSKKYIIILYYVKPARIRLHLAGHKLLSLSCSDGKLLVFDAHTSPRLDR